MIETTQDIPADVFDVISNLLATFPTEEDQFNAVMDKSVREAILVGYLSVLTSNHLEALDTN